MPKGGKRPNSGRKPGTAWAGPKGPRSKVLSALDGLGRRALELEYDGHKKRGVQNLPDLTAARRTEIDAPSRQLPSIASPMSREFPRQVLDITEWQKTISPAARKEGVAPRQEVVWEPQPQAGRVYLCPADDVLFGGARGGGKSDAVLGDWLGHEEQYGQARDWPGAAQRADATYRVDRTRQGAVHAARLQLQGRRQILYRPQRRPPALCIS